MADRGCLVEDWPEVWLRLTLSLTSRPMRGAALWGMPFTRGVGRPKPSRTVRAGVLAAEVGGARCLVALVWQRQHITMRLPVPLACPRI
jgi:hypothetical protein